LIGDVIEDLESTEFVPKETKLVSGDIQNAASRGLGWSTQSPAKTQVLTIKDKEGKRTGTLTTRPPARFDPERYGATFL